MAKQSKNVRISPIELSSAPIYIEGITPLIVNRCTLEALENPTGGREKDEERLFKASLHPMQNGNHVFPSRGMLKAMIGAAYTFIPSIKKAHTRGLMIMNEWLPIYGVPRKRVDIGKNKKGDSIKIVRAEFPEWKSMFELTYDPNGRISLNQIFHLVNAAGQFVGLGCWRPSLGGNFGRFEVVQKFE